MFEFSVRLKRSALTFVNNLNEICIDTTVHKRNLYSNGFSFVFSLRNFLFQSVFSCQPFSKFSTKLILNLSHILEFSVMGRGSTPNTKIFIVNPTDRKRMLNSLQRSGTNLSFERLWYGVTGIQLESTGHCI